MENNVENGFDTLEGASQYVSDRLEKWGLGLVGWVKEEHGRFFPRFNVYD